MTAMLEVKDLKVAYGKILAVKKISFSVDEGQVVTLIGTNGRRQDHDAANDLRAHPTLQRRDPVPGQADRRHSGSRDRHPGSGSLPRGSKDLPQDER